VAANTHGAEHQVLITTLVGSDIEIRRGTMTRTGSTTSTRREIRLYLRSRSTSGSRATHREAQSSWGSSSIGTKICPFWIAFDRPRVLEIVGPEGDATPGDLVEQGSTICPNIKTLRRVLVNGQVHTQDSIKTGGLEVGDLSIALSNQVPDFSPIHE
jgi:hypothetical protein